MTDASSRTLRSAVAFRRLRWCVRLLAAALAASAIATPPAPAAEEPSCGSNLALWGDGRHDDTRALNAWFRGDPVVWAETGRPVGPEIAGRAFVLSSTVYIPSGTGRVIERFEMIWPARNERVAAASIRTGDDPDKPAMTIGLVKIGAGPDEGVPYKAPPPRPGARDTRADCLVS